MKVLNSQAVGYVPVGIDMEVMQKTTLQDRSITAASEDGSVISDVNLGLCINCENNNHCMWQRTNKMFCEHYQ
ncbi:hypothetical protein [Flavobacterium sp. 14A]|uniref:hypothetical protein n=1 Tax=Flavobacterium sp. 14A TaxID=2735896 RepID=UPI00156EB365|nr:hypothetical protein [Flavobacterium sp. 14A]NRT12902.1 hypothetical protein [Flavobacterium sp. 14A]